MQWAYPVESLFEIILKSKCGCIEPLLSDILGIPKGLVIKNFLELVPVGLSQVGDCLSI